MKKITVFFVIVIAILGFIWYIYEENKISINEKISYNNYYESLSNKEILGSEFASILNKAINDNENNEVKKDEKGLYIDNGVNSIKIDVKFKDYDKVIQFEKLSKKDVSEFIDLYGLAKFKLTKIDYHKKGKKVKYLYFEEV